MANTIKIRRSGVPGKVPTLADLSVGELALNYADGKLYCRQVVDGLNSIVEIGGGSGGGGSSGGGGGGEGSLGLTVGTFGSLLSNVGTSVTTLRFDSDAGFSVVPGPNGQSEARVSLGSTFKTWHVAGQDDLIAEGEDEITIEAGQGIVITTSNVDGVKTITFGTEAVGGFDENVQAATIIEIERHNPLAATGTVLNRTELTSVIETAAITYKFDYWFYQGTPTNGDSEYIPQVGDVITIWFENFEGWGQASPEDNRRWTTWDVGTIFYAAQGGQRSFTSETISPDSEYSWAKLEVVRRDPSEFGMYDICVFELLILEKSDYPDSAQWHLGGGFYDDYTILESTPTTVYEFETTVPIPPEKLSYASEGSPIYSRRLYSSELTTEYRTFLEWKPTEAYKEYKSDPSLTGKQLAADENWTMEFLLLDPSPVHKSNNAEFYTFDTNGLRAIYVGNGSPDDYPYPRFGIPWVFDISFNNESLPNPMTGLTDQIHHFALVHNAYSSTVSLYANGVYLGTEILFFSDKFSWIGSYDADWDDPAKDWFGPTVELGNPAHLSGFRFTIGPDCPYITAGTDDFLPPRVLTDATTETSFTLALLDGTSFSFDKDIPRSSGDYTLNTYGDLTSNLKTIALVNSAERIDDIVVNYAFNIYVADATAGDLAPNSFRSQQDNLAIGDSVSLYRSGVPGIYLGPDSRMLFDPLTQSTSVNFVESALKVKNDGVSARGITRADSQNERVAIYGVQAYANIRGTAMGYSASAGERSVAIGDSAFAPDHSIVIGADSYNFEGSNNIIIGNGVYAGSGPVTDALMIQTGKQEHYKFGFSDLIDYPGYRSGTIYLHFGSRDNPTPTSDSSDPDIMPFNISKFDGYGKEKIIYGTVTASLSDNTGNCKVKKSEVYLSNAYGSRDSYPEQWEVTQYWEETRDAWVFSNYSFSFNPSLEIIGGNKIVGKIDYIQSYEIWSDSEPDPFKRSHLLTAMNFDLTISR